MIRKKSNSILLICKDAGAANALSLLVKDWSGKIGSIFNVCIGYAVEIFRNNNLIPEREFNNEPNRTEVKSIINTLKPQAIITGTSLDCWCERHAVLEAKERGIYSLGLIDWWSNFGARFSTPNTNDLKYLPNRIAVMDNDARLGCIADGIPSGLLVTTGNPYWDFLLKNRTLASQLRPEARKRMGISEDTVIVMVISSDIRNSNLNLGYDENDFWKAVIPLPGRTKQGQLVQWMVKPHPREKRQGLFKMLNRYNVNPLVVGNLSSLEAIAAADFIVGMCSTVLFEAVLLEKKVLSVQPGMNYDKLKYLRIFDHLLVSKIIKASEVRDAVQHLINDELPPPRLENIPYPIGNGKASAAIEEVLREDLAGFNKKYERKI